MTTVRTDSAPADESVAHARVEQPYEELLQQVKMLADQLAQLTTREAELRLVLERNLELDPLLDRLGRRLNKKTIGVQAAAAIDGAELHLEPFPYIIVDDLLPTQLYSSLLRGIPPALLFRSKMPGKEHLAVPFTLAPSYSHRVWGHLASELIPRVIAPHSVGAHGAFIPPDALPEDLERYIYQFRVGPNLKTIAMLKSMLSRDRQPLWTGKALVDY